MDVGEHYRLKKKCNKVKNYKIVCGPVAPHLVNSWGVEDY